MDFSFRAGLRTIHAPLLYPEVKDEQTGGQFTFIDDSKVELSKLSPFYRRSPVLRFRLRGRNDKKLGGRNDESYFQTGVTLFAQGPFWPSPTSNSTV